jgi:L-ascorbate metabolism protein UlaG (beta-lactamase superfamily)
MPDEARERVTWLGHATVLLELGGARLLTDPVLRPRVAHLRRHAAAAEDPGPLDAILISHLHRDHLDLRTLRRIDRRVPVVLPAGGARPLRRLRRQVREVRPGDSLRLGGAHVRVVRAVHDGRRHPFGTRVEPLGFVVEGERRVYFAGDTELFEGMAELAGGVDVALLPIWGWGRGLGPGHMDPEQAARALTLLRPEIAVPIHWGTFLPLGAVRRHGHLLTQPAREFAELAARIAPDVRVEILPPGASLPLDRAG